MDKDGIAKPAILFIIEEALEAGIEEVIIIVQKDDLQDFEFFFSDQISIENYNKLPPHFQEYSHRLLEMGRRVTFVFKKTRKDSVMLSMLPGSCWRRAIPVNVR